MKSKLVEREIINIGILEEGPLRLVGFQSILNQVADLSITPMSVAEIATYPHIQLVLLGNNTGGTFFEIMDTVTIVLPGVPVVVTGTGADDAAILKAVGRGAKGYVNESDAPSELIPAIYAVHSGSVWLSRRVMSRFIDTSSSITRGSSKSRCSTPTSREMQVLRMLVEGRSNREIGRPLGIEERTVKAHVSKLMRKVGVTNRIALSIHAVNHALVSA